MSCQPNATSDSTTNSDELQQTTSTARDRTILKRKDGQQKRPHSQMKKATVRFSSHISFIPNCNDTCNDGNDSDAGSNQSVTTPPPLNSGEEFGPEFRELCNDFDKMLRNHPLLSMDSNADFDTFIETEQFMDPAMPSTSGTKSTKRKANSEKVLSPKKSKTSEEEDNI